MWWKLTGLAILVIAAIQYIFQPVRITVETVKIDMPDDASNAAAQAAMASTFVLMLLVAVLIPAIVVVVIWLIRRTIRKRKQMRNDIDSFS